MKFTLCYKVILQVLLSPFTNDFFCVLHKNIWHLNLVLYHLFSPLVQILIFHLRWGREDVASWLAHGRELRELWCCPLPKGLGTNQGPHGQPHSKWLVKQSTNKVTMEPNPKTK